MIKIILSISQLCFRYLYRRTRHAIEDVKLKGSTQQIPFIGVSFVILGMKQLDCTHGVDRCTSIKKKRLEKKN